MANFTRTGTTTRSVLFIDEMRPPGTPVARTLRLDAGTTVYARRLTNGTWRIRVPRTLLTQDVGQGALNLA